MNKKKREKVNRKEKETEKSKKRKYRWYLGEKVQEQPFGGLLNYTK